MLRRDDGGTWHLDGPRDLDAKLGRRVTLSGVRSGFDLIDVDSLNGHAVPRRPIIWSWEFASGVLTTLCTLAVIIVSYAGW